MAQKFRLRRGRQITPEAANNFSHRLFPALPPEEAFTKARQLASTSHSFLIREMFSDVASFDDLTEHVYKTTRRNPRHAFLFPLRASYANYLLVAGMLDALKIHGLDRGAAARTMLTLSSRLYDLPSLHGENGEPSPLIVKQVRKIMPPGKFKSCSIIDYVFSGHTVHSVQAAVRKHSKETGAPITFKRPFSFFEAQSFPFKGRATDISSFLAHGTPGREMDDAELAARLKRLGYAAPAIIDEAGNAILNKKKFRGWLKAHDSELRAQQTARKQLALRIRKFGRLAMQRYLQQNHFRR